MKNMKMWHSQLFQSFKRIAIPLMTHPGIEMIGKKVKDAVQNGKIHAEAIKKIKETYPVDASTVMMDLTLEAEAFGCKIEFQEDEMPHILGRLVSNAEEIEQLKVPGLNTGRIPQYLEAAKITVENETDKPVFAGTIGPFSLAGRLFGMSEIMIACYIEPAAIAGLLSKCTEFILSYCLELKNIGCNGVIIAEPAGGLLSNEDCLGFSSQYIKRIVDVIQSDEFLVVLHNCGNHGHCTQAMLDSGANAYHFGNAIDLVETLKFCPKDKLIMGNIDPVGVMKMKTAREVKACVADLLKTTDEFKNFILSTGCDLPPLVPPENIHAFFDALKEYNQAKLLKEED